MTDRQATVFDDILDLALGRDAARRPTLVRVLTDGFVRDERRRTVGETKQFEELMLHLLPQVDVFTRAVVAQKLATRDDAPRCIVELLAADEPTVSAPILARSPLLARETIARLTATGDASVRAAIAQRVDLSPEDAARLAEKGVTATARDAARPTPEPSDPERDTPAAPAPATNAADLARKMVRAAVLRRRDDLADLLAQALRKPPSLARAILDEDTGEALTAAIKMLDLGEDALAQLLILVNPSVAESYARVVALRERYRADTAETAAAALAQLAPRREVTTARRATEDREAAAPAEPARTSTGHRAA
jgi:uncharacterized protein (DUF2336 family)